MQSNFSGGGMAPFIAGLLANGLQLVANAVLAKGKDFIKEKTGVDVEQAKLSNEDLIKLKQFEIEHEEELQKIRLEDNKLHLVETQAYLADTQNARSREVIIATSEHAPWYNKAVTPFLAVLTVLLTFVAFYQMVGHFGQSAGDVQGVTLAHHRLDDVIREKGSPERIKVAQTNLETAQKILEADKDRRSSQKEIILYILGVLSAIASQIFSYYFGSSKGSARKDETIAKLSAKGE